jgi:hypothetical protein
MVNGDVKTIQTNRTWGQFRSLKQGFENTRGVRLAYYNGTIEILMLGLNHEGCGSSSVTFYYDCTCIS